MARTAAQESAQLAKLLRQQANHRARKNTLPPPLMRALVRVRHRLAAEVTAENLARINAIHAASLHRSVVATVQPGQDKQEAPGVSTPEASTDLNSAGWSHGGCSSECA